ncbi:MAG: hypothetical protein BroJett040_13490 [Oligoflexia bacterium]|nr:MAG: hypothetical protein BroJett040_13490 [Oligoflexia bacterium]
MRILLVLLCFGFVACQKNNSDKQPSGNVGIYQGDLVKKIQEIYNENEWWIAFNHCDVDRKPMILQIAQDLESKRAEIEKIEKESLGKNQNLIAHKINKFTFYTEQSPEAAENRWDSYSKNWNFIIDAYKKIQNTPIDKNWVKLNHRARGIVTDDENRLLNYANFGLSRSRQAIIQSAHDKVDACLNDPQCLSPLINDDEKAYFNDGPEFSLFKRLNQPDIAKDKKREYLERLHKRTLRNANRYKFHINDTIQLRGKELYLPVDGRIFGDEANKVTNYLESIWNTDAQYKIKFDFYSVASQVYQIFVSEVLGERAYVSFNERTMQLYDHDDLFTIAHEFGHVLGFRDYYYATFEPSTCNYVTEYNNGNIMSSGGDGTKALPEHWAELIKNYKK